MSLAVRHPDKFNLLHNQSSFSMRREISAADGSGVLEALRALLEITTVHYSAGKEGMLSLSMSTVQKWKKVLYHGYSLKCILIIATSYSTGLCSMEMSSSITKVQKML